MADERCSGHVTSRSIDDYLWAVNLADVGGGLFKGFGVLFWGAFGDAEDKADSGSSAGAVGGEAIFVGNGQLDDEIDVIGADVIEVDADLAGVILEVFGGAIGEGAGPGAEWEEEFGGFLFGATGAHGADGGDLMCPFAFFDAIEDGGGEAVVERVEFGRADGGGVGHVWVWVDGFHKIASVRLKPGALGKRTSLELTRPDGR